MHALRTNMEAEQVTSLDFAIALKAVPPRITQEQIKFYSSFNESHGNFNSFG